MAKFNLNDLLSERSKQAAVEREKTPPADGMEQLTLDVYDLIPSEDNFYSTQYIADLKQSIALVGLLQPLLVTRDGDKYRVEAGHRRRLACIALVEDGFEQFRYVPCVIKTGEEAEGAEKTILDRLTLILANGFREKSDWERMEETLQTEALIVELRKEVSLKGRTRSILAEFTGIAETQLGRYKSIKNNLIPQLMQAFKAKRLGVSTVYELSGLSLEYQIEAFDMLEERGVLSISDAKALKQAEADSQPMEGQAALEEAEEPAQTAQESTHNVPSGTYATTTEAIEEPQEPSRKPPDEPQTVPETETESKAPQKSPPEPEKTPVERETHGRGCDFCCPDYHGEQTTAEGLYLLGYTPGDKTVLIVDTTTGMSDYMKLNYCPFCGRRLGGGSRD